MDAQQARAGVHAVGQRRERSRSAVGGPAPGDRADEVLARHGEQDRPPELHERGERPQRRDRLLGCLGEVRPRVDDQLLLGHAAVARQRHALA